MLYYLTFIVMGYILGSILFAPLFGKLITKKDIIRETKDQNPGTANAFMQGGMLCGILTLVCDMGKGFIPVFLCANMLQTQFANCMWGIDEQLWGGRSEIIVVLGSALVLVAPVAGHIWPIFHKWKGGKGIAVSFGCLLGYWPNIGAALILACFFILFSLVIRITPHFYRTMASYILGTGIVFVWGESIAQTLGFLMITIIVCIRLHLSTEKREECKVRLLWTR